MAIHGGWLATPSTPLDQSLRSTRLSVRMVKIENSDLLGTIHSSDVSAVETNKWTKTLNPNQQDILFKIDTGADVTVILESFYKIQQDGSLQPTECSLTGAGQ